MAKEIEPSQSRKSVRLTLCYHMYTIRHNSHRDLNKLVMNYLMIEGYKDAAEKFAQEANLNPEHFDMTAIEDRMVIRNAIQNGYIDEAIEKVNDLDPEVIKNRAARIDFFLDSRYKSKTLFPSATTEIN